MILIPIPPLPGIATIELLSFEFDTEEMLNVAYVVAVGKYTLPTIIQIPVFNDSEKRLPAVLEVPTCDALSIDPKNVVVSKEGAEPNVSYPIRVDVIYVDCTLLVSVPPA